jgi:hypothetical protein
MVLAPQSAQSKYDAAPFEPRELQSLAVTRSTSDRWDELGTVHNTRCVERSN